MKRPTHPAKATGAQYEHLIAWEFGQHEIAYQSKEQGRAQLYGGSGVEIIHNNNRGLAQADGTDNDGDEKIRPEDRPHRYP